MDIKAGDIILVHTKKGFIPKAIRFFTGCYYNHCAIVIEAMDRLYVLEAVGRGLIITKSLDDYIAETPQEREIAVMRPVVGVDISVVYDRINEIIGHPYDFKSLLYSQLIKQVSQKYRWVGKKDIKATKRIYCSEACAYAYLHIFPRWWSVAPVDIYDSNDLCVVFNM